MSKRVVKPFYVAGQATLLADCMMAFTWQCLGVSVPVVSVDNCTWRYTLAVTPTRQPQSLQNGRRCSNRRIYTAATEDEAELNLELFAEKWDAQYPTISRSWKAHWLNIIPMFSFPPEIRKVMYTTNAIELLNMTLRKVSKNHRVFPNDEAVLKVIYLAIGNVSKKWTMPIREWKPALNRFAIQFEGRLPKEICP